ncbi:MAG: 3-oxoacyl-[acyl-carrier protein] reductase [Planctomycetota bacterium]|jgi:NAD(P)-dependent dehydrogenase (short-subunit alcohol dehydrogenase family)|uniref:SDR family NAD(P)-dependent oxidoreductase n=1 Tax=Patiriisocius sp. Uisw_047 TaxID=3230969 RepID=UPI0039E7427B
MKNILLIGGSYGIGQAIANRLSETNNVHVASRTSDQISEAITYHTFDVMEDEIATLKLPDAIDGLVFCPGSINLRPFAALKLADFEKDMQLNFFSLVKVVKALIPKLKQAEQASLVFFSTVAVKVGMPYHTTVAASKGAIEGFAKALAAEYAPSFRVNVIAPSLTDTPLASKLLSSEEKKEKMGERHPMKRVGTEEDIAAVAVFLLSDDSSWITGQVIGVDGGMSTLQAK